MNSFVAFIVTATLVSSQCVAGPAKAENRMGYQLLSLQEAAALPHNRGSLGMDIERSQHIVDGGMAFDLIRITGVRRGSAAARAGLRVGDQIIAVDGRVFPSLATFAAYVGSMPPGTAAAVDFIPANGGPAQAQRLAVTVGAAGGSVPAQARGPAPNGMSTGEKVAIGVGAAALIGCYELGCFSHRRPAQATSGQPPNQQPGAARPQSGF